MTELQLELSNLIKTHGLEQTLLALTQVLPPGVGRDEGYIIQLQDGLLDVLYAYQNRYEGEEDELDDYAIAINAIEQKVIEALAGKEVRVQYSAYPTDDNDVPIDNLNDIAALGNVVFEQLDEEEYRSEVLFNPTWLEVTKCANDMMLLLDWTDHCFLEGIKPVDRLDKDAKVYTFIMGS